MIEHHPKDDTLASYAGGTLDEGRRLVVTEHMRRCPRCREVVAGFEAVGGAMLDEIEPVEMSLKSRDAVMARLGEAQPARETPSMGIENYRQGKWRWISPGLYVSAIEMPAPSAARVFLLKAAPGTVLPQHKHSGTELTCVLSGAFIHEGGRYGAGDCDDADEDDMHSPVVDQGEECICLVAMEGNIIFQSLLGRMIQPFVRL